MTAKRKFRTSYDILGIPAHASDDDVRAAYRKLVMRYHPDRNPADRRLAEMRIRALNNAYSHIKTRERRARYNAMLEGHLSRSRGVNDNSGKSGWFPIGDVFRGMFRHTGGDRK